MNSSVTLAPMDQARSSQEWISPVGQTIDDFIVELEDRDPEFKRENELTRPRRELARVVMRRREELGIDREELADRMGTTVAVVSRLERGRQSSSAATLRRLAAALDTRLVYSFEPNGDDQQTHVIVP
jgi:ribosome-binding protein aMBF1 (putative translation factor)